MLGTNTTDIDKRKSRGTFFTFIGSLSLSLSTIIRAGTCGLEWKKNVFMMSNQVASASIVLRISIGGNLTWYQHFT